MIRFVLSLTVAGFMLEGAKSMDIQPVAEQIIADTYNQYALEQPNAATEFTSTERANFDRYLELPQVTDIYPGIGRAIENQKTRKNTARPVLGKKPRWNRPLTVDSPGRVVDNTLRRP